MPLWPDAAPGELTELPTEADTTKPTDAWIAGKSVIRLGNVSKPTITIYRAPLERSTGAAVLVCPGGGYHILAMDLEGTEVCEWLNSIGVTAILLKYRVPARQGRPRHEAPLQDAQRALSLTRQHAAEWGLDPQRLGILGCSAGGHLAAVAGGDSETRTYPTLDDADRQSCRPNFAVLIYPASLTVQDEGDKIAPEVKLSAQAPPPPTFIAMSEDDPVRVEGALLYALALKKANVPLELHVYPSGEHGYGLRPSGHLVTTWPQRAAEWLDKLGVLRRASAQ